MTLWHCQRHHLMSLNGTHQPGLYLCDCVTRIVSVWVYHQDCVCVSVSPGLRLHWYLMSRRRVNGMNPLHFDGNLSQYWFWITLPLPSALQNRALYEIDIVSHWQLREMTDADMETNPVHFVTDTADTEIWINQVISIWILDHFWSRQVNNQFRDVRILRAQNFAQNQPPCAEFAVRVQNWGKFTKWHRKCKKFADFC